MELYYLHGAAVTAARYAVPSAMATRKVRVATVSDLPVIHDLIRHSFAAMEKHSCLGRAFWLKAAEGLIKSELSGGSFQATYLDKGSDSCFWVAEINSEIVGCIGMKRKTGKECRDAELVRMGVSPEQRSKGHGEVLVKEVISYCREKLQGHVDRVVLTTANPEAARFYRKVGFKDCNFLFYHSMIMVL